MGSWSVLMTSPQMTMKLGEKLGKLVQGGEIIGLVGELGSGKTCFVRGFALGVKVDKNAWVRSPTFTLINEYQGRLPVYHIDLYRIGRQDEIEALNLREYLYSDGVSLIEWFEHLPADQTREHLEVEISHAGGAKRRMTLTAHGARYERLLEALRKPSSKKSRAQGIQRSMGNGKRG